jgi:hypothetical protein
MTAAESGAQIVGSGRKVEIDPKRPSATVTCAARFGTHRRFRKYRLGDDSTDHD